MIACFSLIALVLTRQVLAGGAEQFSPVTAAEALQVVAAHLRSRGVHENQLPRAEDIELPFAAPAFPERKLRLSSSCWDSLAERMRFRLECQPGACLPFWVYGRVGDGVSAPPCQKEARAHVELRKSAPMVRTGEKVTAVLNTGDLRMTAVVTCLERGALGEVVRVRGQQGMVFQVRIAGPALVEIVTE